MALLGRHRMLAALLAMMLTAVVGGLLSSPLAAADPGDPPPSDSAVTVSGKGAFADLTVTVSQTKNLINQTVTVSWTGAKPTVDNIEFYSNFLQIMQCWGDDPAGPDRTQCQFGASGVGRTNSKVVGREVTYPLPLVDAEEEIPRPASGVNYVPFWAVGQPKPTGPGTSNINEFFNSQVTNEIPLARTRGDGTGKEFFEVQTLRQAAGLGCGEPVDAGGSITGRRCWLVVVPRNQRNQREVNGDLRDGKSAASSLESSPLSQSNWNNRIVVPLEFQPVGQACPIGAAERLVSGHELLADAFSSWQPALCAGGGTLFSYTQLTDEIARSAVDSRLAIVTNPISPDQVPADRPLVYAPVGLSGLTIAFNVEHQVLNDAPPDELQLNGLRFTSMKLTPRLIAKLLTQSYRRAVEIPEEEVKNNPQGLLYDREFLDLNPEYEGFAAPGESVPDALVQINGADVTSLLWSWIKADPDASAFLAGTPDEFGMRVNPYNKNLALPTSTFPRNDPSCSESTDDTVPGLPVILRTCSLDSHPFANDMHDAGRSTSRGDTLGRTVVAAENRIPVSKKLERQGLGRRALVAVVDAATAARYGLPTAQLLNAAGKFVAPTTESLLAGQAAMKPSEVAGVLASDPGAGDPAAYPLTALSYAVTAPSTLDPAARKDYAAFLRYAGGPGQQQGLKPGQLPFGMVPLPDALKAQTIAAATTIEPQTSQTPASPPAPQATAAPTLDLTGRSNTAAGTGATTTSSGGGGPAATPAGVTAQTGGPPAKTPSPARQPVASSRRTPSLLVPAVGGLFVTIVICAALAAASPPVMHLLRTSPPVRYLLGAAARRRAAKEVMPTER